MLKKHHHIEPEGEPDPDKTKETGTEDDRKGKPSTKEDTGK